MHRGVTSLPGFGPGRDPGRTHGLTGLVYGMVRGVTRLAGAGVDRALARMATGAAEGSGGDGHRSEQGEAVLAALNGVLGDHLAATGNPLAIPMRLRHAGRPLTLERRALEALLATASPGGRHGDGRRLLVLVHGSCLNDLRWRRDDHDHGEALARDLGFTPVYLHYNTGLHVSTNGHALAGLLETLLREWPAPLDRFAILAHSMGGLVTRSACHHAAGAGQAWLGRLGDALFLGTPHHGAPLERGGSLVDLALGVSHYSAPLARLGQIRSAGVTDLRHGSLLDQDWLGKERFAAAGALPAPVPLPPGVRCFALAGTTSFGGALAGQLVGDGLVPLDSALGRHPDPARDLGFPAARRWVGRGLNHFELLSDLLVYRQLLAWLEG
jgi:hypothetical protein